MRDTTVGVYLHVPFCERVCPYCDFPVLAARPLGAEAEQAYVDALLRELEARRGDYAGLALETVYLGGGTPSLLAPASVARLVAAVREAFPGRAPAEVTLETNPSTVEAARLPGFRAAGVTRVSLGVQSFDDGVLKRLGRAHRAALARETLAACRRAGFERLSVDLIFAAPGQTRAGFERDLEEALAFGPDHVSAYGLTIEPGTPFAQAEARGPGRGLGLPDEEEAAAMYEHAHARLAAAGLPAYELSSFARPGCESRHNRRYWRREPVLGLGMGAWSTEPRGAGAPFGSRRANVRTLAGYLEAVGARGRADAGPPEVLDAPTARGEAAFLALRTREGIDTGRFEAEFGVGPEALWAEDIEALVAGGLLERVPGALRLTPRGRLLSDSVFERFVAPAPRPRPPRRIRPRVDAPTPRCYPVIRFH